MNGNAEEYKAIIINGINDKGDVDGQINFVGKKDKYDFHVDCLLDYAIEKYPTVQVFKVIPSNCEPDVPVYFLTVLNNIVYLNVSGGRNGRRGILFMPDEISPKQKEVLCALSKRYTNINVDIIYNMDFDDGLVYSEEFDCKRGMKFEDVLNDFFNTQYEKKPKS